VWVDDVVEKNKNDSRKFMKKLLPAPQQESSLWRSFSSLADGALNLMNPVGTPVARYGQLAAAAALSVVLPGVGPSILLTVLLGQEVAHLAADISPDSRPVLPMQLILKELPQDKQYELLLGLKRSNPNFNASQPTRSEIDTALKMLPRSKQVLLRARLDSLQSLGIRPGGPRSNWQIAGSAVRVGLPVAGVLSPVAAQSAGLAVSLGGSMYSVTSSVVDMLKLTDPKTQLDTIRLLNNFQKFMIPVGTIGLAGGAVHKSLLFSIALVLAVLPDSGEALLDCDNQRLDPTCQFNGDVCESQLGSDKAKVDFAASLRNISQLVPSCAISETPDDTCADWTSGSLLDHFELEDAATYLAACVKAAEGTCIIPDPDQCDVSGAGIGVTEAPTTVPTPDPQDVLIAQNAVGVAQNTAGVTQNADNISDLEARVDSLEQESVLLRTQLMELRELFGGLQRNISSEQQQTGNSTGTTSAAETNSNMSTGSVVAVTIALITAFSALTLAVIALRKISKMRNAVGPAGTDAERPNPVRLLHVGRRAGADAVEGVGDRVDQLADRVAALEASVGGMGRYLRQMAVNALSLFYVPAALKERAVANMKRDLPNGLTELPGRYFVQPKQGVAGADLPGLDLAAGALRVVDTDTPGFNGKLRVTVAMLNAGNYEFEEAAENQPPRVLPEFFGFLAEKCRQNNYEFEVDFKGVDQGEVESAKALLSAHEIQRFEDPDSRNFIFEQVK